MRGQQRMARAERMSAVDTTWLRMDRPSNPMVILGVFTLDGPVDLDRLERTLADRLLAHDRFRQRAEPRSNGLWWVDDRRFDVSRHIHRVRLPGRGGDAELETFVGELAATPLDHGIPLWQFHIVEHFQGGAAVVVRIHHAIADGIALIGVMLSLTDEMHGSDEEAHWTDRADRAHGEGWSDLLAPLGRAIGLGARLGGRLLKASRPARALGLVRDGFGVASELAGLLLMSNDSPTSLKGVPDGAKRVAWAEPLPLADVKAVAHALDCSVNDVLMSCVAGAVHRYMSERGEATTGVELRTLIPVNLRSPERRATLGNEFGLVTLMLPVGLDDPTRRLAEVRRRMNALKRSRQAGVVYGLLGILGHAPKGVQDRLFDVLLSRATAVMTNVPGPQTPMSIAGSKLSRLMFWVPQSGDIGIGVSILSYGGDVQFGLVTDAALVPEPRRLVAGFVPEFERLLYRTLLDHADRPESASAADRTPAPRKPAPRRRATSKTTAPKAAAPKAAPPEAGPSEPVAAPIDAKAKRPRRRRPTVEAPPVTPQRPTVPRRRRAAPGG